MAATALVLAGELTRKTGLRCAALAGDGAYEFEITGEERYQAALAKLAGGGNPGVVGVKCMALLVPASNKPNEPSTVLVQISGHDVGYLGRNLAPIVSRALANAGYSAAIASAVIVAGSPRDKTGRFRVRLDAVHPFRFEDAGEEKPQAPSAPRRAAAAAAAIAAAATATGTATRAAAVATWRSLLPRLQTLRRLALAAVKNTARQVTDGYRYVRESPRLQARLGVGAIFLAGVVVGSGLTLWVRPASTPPALMAAPAPQRTPAATPLPEPEAAADDADVSFAPTPADVPLPRPRPEHGTAAEATSGSQ